LFEPAEEQTSKRGQETDEVGQIVLWVAAGIVFLSLLPVVIAAFLLHVILVRMLDKERVLYFLTGVAALDLVYLYQARKLFAFLGFVSSLHVPYVSTGVDRVFHNSTAIPITAYSFLSLLSFSIIIATIYQLYERYLMKKEVVSKKSKIDKKRTSVSYKKFKEKRLPFLGKEQKKYRKSGSTANFIGYIDDKKRLELTDKELNQHIFGIGTTGSGKTTLIAALIECALRKDKPIIFMDGKGERETLDRVLALCDAYGKKVHVFSDLDTLTYNPLRHGSPTVVRDKLMSLFEWSEPYYKNQCSRFLQLLVKMLHEYHIKCDLHTVYHYLQESHLKAFFEAHRIEKEVEVEVEVEVEEVLQEEEERKQEAADELVATFLGTPVPNKENAARPFAITMEKQTKTIRVMDEALQAYHQKFFEEIDLDAVSNLRNQVAELLESDLGELFTEKAGGLDLQEITDRDEIVIFSLSGNKYQDYIQTLGRLVVMDVNNLVDHRFKVGKKSIFAIYDEFSAYANHEIVDIINKSRSAGFECLISTQGLSDIDRLDPNLTRQILNNCNTYCAGRVNDDEDAEKLAKMFGTYTDVELTIQTERRLRTRHFPSEKGTSREVERFSAHPDEIKKLTTGEMFICRKSEGGTVKRVYVRNAFDVTGGVT
jgi:type IV secretory pathway TraG/TraD family ATPase VirD4